MIAKILISNSPEQIKEEIEKILKKEGLKNNHPDVLFFPADTKLGVGEAKEIREFFSIKPYQSKGRTIVMENASLLTIEAQNALLKTLEEPPEEAILLLGANNADDFLPTILSRCQIVVLPTNKLINNKLTGYSSDIEMLLNIGIERRFEYIEKLKDQKAKEEFLRALTAYFRNKMLQTSHDRGANEFVKDILEAEGWADANVNIRGILEYLMLVMPKSSPKVV